MTTPSSMNQYMSGSTYKFDIGIGAVATNALLELTQYIGKEAAAILEQFYQQIQQTLESGKATAKTCEEQGHDQFSGALSQGITGVVGGLGMLGVSAKEAFSSSGNDLAPFKDLSVDRNITATELDTYSSSLSEEQQSLKEKILGLTPENAQAFAQEVSPGDVKDLFSNLTTTEAQPLSEKIEEVSQSLKNQGGLSGKKNIDRMTSINQILNSTGIGLKGLFEMQSSYLDGQKTLIQSTLDISKSSADRTLQQFAQYQQMIAQVIQSEQQVIAAVTSKN